MAVGITRCGAWPPVGICGSDGGGAGGLDGAGTNAAGSKQLMSPATLLAASGFVEALKSSYSKRAGRCILLRHWLLGAFHHVSAWYNFWSDTLSMKRSCMHCSPQHSYRQQYQLPPHKNRTQLRGRRPHTHVVQSM